MQFVKGYLAEPDLNLGLLNSSSFIFQLADIGPMGFLNHQTTFTHSIVNKYLIALLYVRYYLNIWDKIVKGTYTLLYSRRKELGKEKQIQICR